MKNKQLLVACRLSLVALFLSGCVIRTTSRDADRVDQELTKGNRGVVSGVSKGSGGLEQKKTRKIYDIEIELPFGAKGEKVESKKLEQKKEEAKKADKASAKTANIAITQPIRGSRLTTKGLPPAVYPKIAPVRVDEKRTLPETKPQVVIKESPKAIEKEKEVKKELLKEYVVQKGDTLQKISSKIYGTTRNWKRIYEANKTLLVSPDRIKPGQKLVIPK